MSWTAVLLVIVASTVSSKMQGLDVRTVDVTARSSLNSECANNMSCHGNQYCSSRGVCECLDGFTPTRNCTCVILPLDDDCAGSPGMGCCCVLTGSCGSDIDFYTVAQIALASALVVTMVAVFGVFWRAFVQDRCASLCRQTRTEDETLSINSIERFVIQRMQDRPPRYDTQLDKPPPYAQCVADQEQSSSRSGQPPPYSIAVSQDRSDTLPSQYVLQESASCNPNLVSTPLNVMSATLQSPEDIIEDSVLYSESESSDSFNYNSLNSEENVNILDSSSTTSSQMSTPYQGSHNHGFVRENETSHRRNSR